MAGNIFINYRRDESGHVAGRLHESLAPKFGGDKLFMDVDNIPVGKDFENYLKSQVAACDAMLAIIGPNWLTAKDETGQRRLDNPEDFVVIEIAAALARDIAVVPVLVDGARMPKASELPDSLKPLARRQAIEVRHTNFKSDAETLIKRLREVLGYSPGHRLWYVKAGIGVAALAVLLLIGWVGYTTLRHTVERGLQQAELRWVQERTAREAEANRKVTEAEQQRVAEQERQAKAEAEAKRKADEAEQQRLASAKFEQERQARAAEFAIFKGVRVVGKEYNLLRSITVARCSSECAGDQRCKMFAHWEGDICYLFDQNFDTFPNPQSQVGLFKAAAEADAKRKADEIEANRKAVEVEQQRQAKSRTDLEPLLRQADQQRQAIFRAEQERQKAAADAEAKRKADETERQRQAAIQAEQERQAKAAPETETNRTAERERQFREELERQKARATTDRAVCVNALTLNKTGWDEHPLYSNNVAEARRRGLTVDACRQLVESKDQ